MNILIVDDEAVQRNLLKGFLENNGYRVLCAENGEKAVEIFRNRLIHLVILDNRMPGKSGDEVLREIKEINPLVRAFMITAYSDVNTAVTVMKLGADEYIEKPVDLPELLEKIKAVENSMAQDNDVAEVEEILRQDPLPLKITAESPLMKEVISMACRVSKSPFAVLIQGETGTGKELIAKLIHLLSNRKDNPFIVANCAAIPENLFESELFGHEKGAFTNAVSRRKGRFELAHNGTLFLDEIGELPGSLQPKLLRSLQENIITRVGSETDTEVNVRLISATNRTLKKMCETNKFREDLFFRIKVFEINIPALRHRREDIPALVDLFLQRYADREISFSENAMDSIIKYPFPGNVRELENIVQRTITLSRNNIITAEELPEEVRRHRATSQGNLTERLEAVERDMLMSALEKNNRVQTKAARILGISERVLRYKMKKHGIKGR
jgi:DNA-binding NtrC family response regulator